MEHSEFKIGEEFRDGDHTYLCTDKGTRTILAIRVDTVTVDGAVIDREQAEKEGWFNGPPYALLEHVFDEYDMEACDPITAAD